MKECWINVYADRRDKNAPHVVGPGWASRDMADQMGGRAGERFRLAYRLHVIRK